MLEVALNKLFLRDAGMQAARLRLVGKVLCVELQEVNTPFFLVFSARQVDILGKWDGNIDCTVKTGFSVLRILHDRQQLFQVIRSGELIVEGDLQLVQQVMALLDPAQWDPAECLAPYLGDIAAQSVEQLLRKSIHFFHSTVQRQQLFLAEIITEEYQLAPNPLQISCFNDEVDAVTSAVNSLSARLAMMETH